MSCTPNRYPALRPGIRLRGRYVEFPSPTATEHHHYQRRSKKKTTNTARAVLQTPKGLAPAVRKLQQLLSETWLTFDTETYPVESESADGIPVQFPFQVAWSITKKDDVLVERNYYVLEAFLPPEPVVLSTFFKNQSNDDVDPDKVVSASVLLCKLRDDLNDYGVAVVSAFNLPFDWRSIKTLIQCAGHDAEGFFDSKATNPFPLGLVHYDIMWNANVVLADQIEQRKCSGKGKKGTYSMDAILDILFPGMSQPHTALEDVRNEIMVARELIAKGGVDFNQYYQETPQYSFQVSWDHRGQPDCYVHCKRPLLRGQFAKMVRKPFDRSNKKYYVHSECYQWFLRKIGAEAYEGTQKYRLATPYRHQQAPAQPVRTV